MKNIAKSVLGISLCLSFLSGCPAMVLDRMKNKREFWIENISFQKKNYPTIGIIPYSYSESNNFSYDSFVDGKVQKIDTGRIDLGYANKIFDVCSHELKRNHFTIINQNRVLDFINRNNIDLTNDAMALDMEKVKKDNNIHKIGTGLNVNAVMAIDIKLLSHGFWYTGNYTELEVFLFDANTEELIWRGYAATIHESMKDYREKIFRIIFRRLFASLNE